MCLTGSEIKLSAFFVLLTREKAKENLLPCGLYSQMVAITSLYISLCGQRTGCLAN